MRRVIARLGGGGEKIQITRLFFKILYEPRRPKRLQFVLRKLAGRHISLRRRLRVETGKSSRHFSCAIGLLIIGSRAATTRVQLGKTIASFTTQTSVGCQCLTSSGTPPEYPASDEADRQQPHRRE